MRRLSDACQVEKVFVTRAHSIDISQMDSGSTLVNAVNAEATPIGSVNQGVSLPKEGLSAAGKYGSPSGTARDTDASINVLSFMRGTTGPRLPERRLPIHTGHGVRRPTRCALLFAAHWKAVVRSLAGDASLSRPYATNLGPKGSGCAQDASLGSGRPERPGRCLRPTIRVFHRSSNSHRSSSRSSEPGRCPR